MTTIVSRVAIISNLIMPNTTGDAAARAQTCWRAIKRLVSTFSDRWQEIFFMACSPDSYTCGTF